MLKRKIMKMKDSRLLNIPAHLCHMLNIEAGDEFYIEVKEGKIIATPVQPTKAQTDVAPAKPERMCQHE